MGDSDVKPVDPVDAADEVEQAVRTLQGMQFSRGSLGVEASQLLEREKWE